MRNRGAGRPLLSVLNALSNDPDTFSSFLHYLAPEDLQQAWGLAFALAQEDDIGKNNCAELLGSWCTAQLLIGIAAVG